MSGPGGKSVGMTGKSRLISIIGPPACGKTTLANSLAERLGAELILEDFQGNPFLAAAFGGDRTAKLPAQLYFLASRVSQLDGSGWPAGRLHVSDYGFCQDAIYARRLLAGEELAFYHRIADTLSIAVYRPDVIILLDASVETLADRIASRGRKYEKAFDWPFLQDMRNAYNDPNIGEGAPVIRIDCDKTDIRRPDAINEIAKQIMAEISA